MRRQKVIVFFLLLFMVWHFGAFVGGCAVSVFSPKFAGWFLVNTLPRSSFLEKICIRHGWEIVSPLSSATDDFTNTSDPLRLVTVLAGLKDSRIHNFALTLRDDKNIVRAYIGWGILIETAHVDINTLSRDQLPLSLLFIGDNACEEKYTEEAEFENRQLFYLWQLQEMLSFLVIKHGNDELIRYVYKNSKLTGCLFKDIEEAYKKCTEEVSRRRTTNWINPKNGIIDRDSHSLF